MKKEKIETGIYLYPESKTYLVLFSVRDPKTRQSRSLRRLKDNYGNHIKSLTQARILKEELKSELLKRKNNPNEPLWLEAVAMMIKEMNDDFYASTTVFNYESSLNKHTTEIWRYKKVTEITTLEIKQLFKEKDWMPHQKKSMVKHIKRVFEYCVENGYLNRNPMPKIRVKAPAKLKSFLNEQEIVTLLSEAKSCKNDWYPIWFTAIHTGMRNSELRGLTWDCVDLNAKLIYVIKTLKLGKDDLPEEQRFDLTKSKVDRVVPISKPLLNLLMSLKEVNDSIYVLPRLDKWRKGEQSKELRDYLDELELPSIRFHDLRASFCTLMLTKGVPPITVMAIGGWSEMKTMDKYIRMAGVNVKGQTDVLESIDYISKIDNVVSLTDFKSNR
jgi:integrase